MQQIYVLIAIGVLAVIAALMLFTKRTKPEAKLSFLAGLSFAFIIAGIVFGENRLAGYSLIGVGVSFALIDAAKKLRKRRGGC